MNCEGCGKEIETNNSIDWMLKLSDEKIPQKGGAVTDMMIYPTLRDDLFFCRVSCIYKWITMNYPQVAH